MRNTALLVIDVQVEVMAECHAAAEVVSRIAALVDRARAADVLIVWVQHHDEYLIRESPGWQLVPELEPAAGELRIFKTYSDSFSGTELEAELQTRAVERLVLCGAQTDFCIRNTWHSALVRGFDTVLVTDAHTTADAHWDGKSIAAETIVAFTNMYAECGSTYPNGHGSTVRAAELGFDPPA